MPLSSSLNRDLLGLLQFKTLKDDTLAYSFSYPVNAGDEKLPVVLSRRPERCLHFMPLDDCKNDTGELQQ